MITSNIVWWTFVLRHVKNFDIDIRYDVYADPNAQARISRLNGDGEELARGYAAFSSLQFLVQTLSWYYALHGINILLVIARILNLMHFQPRLGVVTRSLLLAGPDLLHFTVVAGIVFVGYAMMAHVIFGNVIEKFSTFRLAIDTCFEMLLGEISVNEELKALTGLQGLAGAALALRPSSCRCLGAAAFIVAASCYLYILLAPPMGRDRAALVMRCV